LKIVGLVNGLRIFF